VRDLLATVKEPKVFECIKVRAFKLTFNVSLVGMFTYLLQYELLPLFLLLLRNIVFLLDNS